MFTLYIDYFLWANLDSLKMFYVLISYLIVRFFFLIFFMKFINLNNDRCSSSFKIKYITHMIINQRTSSLQTGHLFSFWSHWSMHFVWYSWWHLFKFLIFWPFSKFSKQIEQVSSVLSVLRFQTFSGISLISDGFNPLLTFPFLYSSSNNYS